MKPTHMLLYDQDCPLCNWYTGAFIRHGFLSRDGRLPYSEAVEHPELTFDATLSRNKIALVDPVKGTVEYGIDSLLTVLGNRFPLIPRIGKLPVIHWLLEQLYSFISYNRKMVAPSDCGDSCACTPTLSIGWRIAFIAFCCWIVNIATGVYFTQQLGDYFIGHPVYSDLVMFVAQFGFQFLAFRMLHQRGFADYAGNLAFVSLLGALLLLFFHFGLNFLTYLDINTTMLQPFCYGLVYLFMLYEHARRLRLLHLSGWLSISWIVFRFLIYPFAFIV